MSRPSNAIVPAAPTGLLGGLGLALLLAACSSTPEEDPEAPPRFEIPEQPGSGGSSGRDVVAKGTERPPEEQSIGFYLSDLDRSITAWHQAKFESHEPKMQTRKEMLEEQIAYRAQLRLPELIAQLESPAARNRAVAAVALGFSGDPEVQGPLLARLSDRNDEVVGNALMGIGVLALPDTPLAPICTLLRTHPDPWTRNNAAYALQRLLAVGASGACAVDAARQGLVDTEPGVRVQSALILGLELDTESVDTLGALLHDEENMVAAAAARTLSYIGSRSVHHKGACARLLADALDTAPSSRRGRLLYELSQLSDRFHGEDAQPWREWARQIP